MQDYEQALELDPTDMTVKSRISVIHNEFGVAAYQEKRFSVSRTKCTELRPLYEYETSDRVRLPGTTALPFHDRRIFVLEFLTFKF